MPSYQSHVLQTQGGVFTAVVMDGEGREIDRRSFATLNEAQEFAAKRLRTYQGPFEHMISPVNRLRAALRHLKDVAERMRIKPRFDRDDVL